MPRLAPKLDVLRELFALSGNRCAFPGCDHILVNQNGKFVAQICHIEGVKGERYNAKQTDEARRDADNLMLMCLRHHVETDDVEMYPVERMRKMKVQHESAFKEEQFQLSEEVLNGVLSDISNKLDQVLQHTSRLMEGQSALSELIQSMNKKLNSPINTVSGNDIVEDEFLILIKDLKKKAKVHTALDLLTDHKDRHWNKLSEEKKAKVVGHLADCYFDLQNTKMAAEQLLELENINLENEETLSLRAIAYALLGRQKQFAETFEKVKTFNPENPNAWIAYIWITDSAQLDVDTIPASLMRSPEILFNIGDKCLNRDDRKQGIEFFKRSIALQSGSEERAADSKSMIAIRLLSDLSDPFRYRHGHYTEDDKRDLDEAITLFTEAWDVFKYTELKNERAYNIMNRGVAYQLKNELDKSLVDLQLSYDMIPHLQAFKNLTGLYCQMGKLEMANELTSEWEKKMNMTVEEDCVVSFTRARIQYLKNDLEGAIQRLKKLYDTQEMVQGKEALEMIVAFYLGKKKFAEADEYCDQLIREYTDMVTGYLLKGTIAFQTGHTQKAISFWDQAFQRITDETPTFEVYELASVFVDAEEYTKAATLFDRIADKRVANAMSRGLVYAYYQDGKIGLALPLALHLFAIDKTSPFLVEIISNIYIEIQQLEKARQIVEDFILVVPGRLRDTFLLRCAHVNYLCRKVDRAVELVLMIQRMDTFSMDDAFLAAKILVNGKSFVPGVTVALNTRNRFFQECAAHETYIAIFQKMREAEGSLFPGEVGQECVVKVEDVNGEGHHFYLGNGSTPGFITQLTREDPLAKALMGRKVGDECRVAKKFGLEIRYRIVAILGIPVFAFGQSKDLLDTKFAGQTEFTVVKEGADSLMQNLTHVIRDLDSQRRSFINQGLELYQRGMVTIGVMAGIFRENLVMQWLKLVSHTDVGVYCYSHNESADLQLAIKENRPLILDLTTLLTLFFTYPDHDALDGLSNRWHVAGSAITELQEAYDELSAFSSDGRLSVAYQNGELVRGFIEPKEIQRQMTILRQIIDWCHTPGVVRVPASLLAVSREERMKLAKLLHQSCYDTILLAQEMNGMVVSNDEIFKNFIREQYRLGSFSTFQLSMHRYETKQISTEQVEKIVTALLCHNHLFIPVTDRVLFMAFEKAGFAIRAPFTTAVKGLRAIDAFHASNHAIRFLKRLYPDPGFALIREHVVGYMLMELSRNPQFEAIRMHIKVAIDREFRLLPLAATELSNLIDSYAVQTGRIVGAR